MRIAGLSLAAVVLGFVGVAAGPAPAQVNVEAQCAGASGKAYSCCVQIVKANPGIGQCAKEVAVFRCIGNKNSKYVSPNGCAMPKL